MKNISEIAKNYKDVEEVKRAIRSLQSRKSRLRKQKARSDYNELMTEIVKQEQILKEVREYFEPKKLTVTTMTQSDIEQLNFDETVKAIKSIQSKKCNVQYDNMDLETNEEYQEALRIEEMLQEHRKNVRPVEDTVVRKSDINNLIQHLQSTDENVPKEYVIEQLQKLMNS